MSLTAERLRTLRRTYAGRGDARDGRDIAYLVYQGVLLVAIVAFPVVRAVVVLLAQPPVLSALSSPVAGTVAGSVCAVLLAVLVCCGRIRGPVLLQPFFVTLLAGTDLRRAAALLRPFLTSAFVVTALATGAGAVLGGVLLAAGAASVASAVGFLGVCACTGLVGSLAWLAGQRLAPSQLTAVVSALVAGSALLWVHPAVALVLPWGWVGLSWPTADTPGWVVPAVAGLTLAALLSLRRQLDALDGNRLLEEAQRWQTAGTAAYAGDVASALGSFRARPTTGRAWTAVSGRGSATRFLRRDLVATLRTPSRFAVGMVLLLAAGAVSALALRVDPSTAWVVAGAGAATGFLAAGVFSDGFRHAAEASTAPPIYGVSTHRLYALHALLPMAVALVAAAVGAAVAVAVGTPPVAIVVGALLLPALVLLRAYDSAKGDLPVVLLTPASTPVGDASGLLVLAWQADSLLAAAVLGSTVCALAGSGRPVLALLVVLAVIVVLPLALRRRLDNL